MQAEAGQAGAQEQRAEIRIDAEVLAECLAECQEDGQAECQKECQLGSFQGHVDHDSGHKGRHMDHESGHVLGSPAQEEEHPLDPRTQAGVDHFRLQKRKFDRLPDLEVPGHSAQTEEHPLDPRIYWMNKLTVDTIKGSVDMFYNGRDFARFYVLETVARVPYFAYLSVLHCRETLGVRAPDLRERMRTHYAESDNELHHLLIMESLGGNAFAADRAIAQTLAFFYYWYVVAVYSLSEQAAYHLSELIEDHAYATYDKFLKENEARLRAMPVPDVARQYYEADSPCWFDQFCTTAEPGTPPRRRELEDGCCMTCPEDKFDEATGRPRLASLYDVFVNVRNDEREHWKTLCNLVQYDSLNGPVRVVAPSKPDAAKME
jgi:ubiquinol oxidase